MSRRDLDGVPDFDRSAVDPDTFRDGMSAVPTAVTVVTIPRGEGPCGVTIGSFASLSLDPPLASYNLARSAEIYSDAITAERFAVHVLLEDQVHLSNRFAKPDLHADEQLAGLEVSFDSAGVPLLNRFMTRFMCRLVNVYDGGDHSIIVGRIEAIDYDEPGNPLIYYQRGYHSTGGASISPEDPVPKKAKS